MISLYRISRLLGTKLVTAGLALCAVHLSAPIPAQALPPIYDHFDGKTIKLDKWLPWGNTSGQLSLPGTTLLKMNLSASQDVGINSVAGFQGDFDFVLDFQNFTPTVTGTQNQSEISMFVCDALGSRAGGEDLGIVLGLSGSTQQKYIGWSKTRNTIPSFYFESTTATDGWLRLTRNNSALTVSYWDSKTKLPKILLNNYKPTGGFLTNIVYVEVGGETDANAKLTVESDWIRHSGQVVPGPKNFGSGCNGLLAQAYSFPFRGNQNFAILVDGGMPFAKAPLAFVLGLTRYPSPGVALHNAPGCFLHVQFLLLHFPSPLDKYGQGILYLPIPNNAKLLGATFYSQFAAATTLNALGLASTPGVACKIF